MKKVKQFRTAVNIIMTVSLAVATPVLVTWQETSARQDSSPEASERSGAGGGCSDLSGKWETNTSEGNSTWEFFKASDSAPMYDVRETSPGRARGTAGLLQENILRFEFDARTAEGERYAGVFRCKLDKDCQSSLSPCKLALDQGRTGTYEADIKRR